MGAARWGKRGPRWLKQRPLIQHRNLRSNENHVISRSLNSVKYILQLLPRLKKDKCDICILYTKYIVH